MQKRSISTVTPTCQEFPRSLAVLLCHFANSREVGWKVMRYLLGLYWHQMHLAVRASEHSLFLTEPRSIRLLSLGSRVAGFRQQVLHNIRRMRDDMHSVTVQWFQELPSHIQRAYALPDGRVVQIPLLLSCSEVLRIPSLDLPFRISMQVMFNPSCHAAEWTRSGPHCWMRY